MLTHPETAYLIARRTHAEQLQHALRRHDLRDAGLSGGLRGAIASALREAADRVDTSPQNGTAPDRRQHPAG